MERYLTGLIQQAPVPLKDHLRVEPLLMVGVIDDLSEASRIVLLQSRIHCMALDDLRELNRVCEEWAANG